MRVGSVAEMWRYPVKSMGGEQLAAADVRRDGLPGDRGWALRDEEAGEIRGARTLVGLLSCRARYLADPEGTAGVPDAEVTLPDGRTITTAAAADLAEALSELVGRPVSVWPRSQATPELLRRARFRGSPEAVRAEIERLFALEPDDPFPDFSFLPPALTGLVAPPGTFFDVFPLHMVTTSGLADLQDRNPAAVVDVRRFRPNVLLDTGTEPATTDQGWAGRRLRVGEAVVQVEVATLRCAMTTQAQPWAGIPKDRSIIRTLVKETGQNLGVYATVVEAGHVEVGDPVELLAGDPVAGAS